jgi:hypothetical protein
MFGINKTDTNFFCLEKLMKKCHAKEFDKSQNRKGKRKEVTFKACLGHLAT